jgi:uncharacterized protein (DUF3084 family)
LGRVQSESASLIHTASAREVFEILSAWKDGSITLSIQHELVNDPDAVLNETSAGRVLLGHVDETLQLYETELRKIRENIEDASPDSPAGTMEVAAHEHDYASQILKLKQDQKAMRATLIDVHREEKDQLMAQLESLEQSWQD